ncbi:hypothetical protein RF11_06563 [Thelohanellus kitauei]|uniref:Uncharacterized protein n=1 Tax=Thelohanellus kitauei TaxID=669202 RepID=A0A0C2NBD4_THEKT|nr:hypothetical protein RF11_06563 [Thelohanellus kitauei]
MSYKGICDFLRKRFALNEQVNRNLLLSCRMEPGETFVTLSSGIRRLVNASYPSFDIKTREALYLVKYMIALPPIYSKKICHKRSINRIYEARKNCESIVAIDTTYSSPHVLNVDNNLESRLDDITQKMERFFDTIREMKEENTQDELNLIRRTNPSEICFNCKQRSRIARYCSFRKTNYGDEPYQVLSVQNHSRNLIKVVFDIDNVQLEGILDTGYTIFLMSFHLFSKHFSAFKL